VSEAFGKRTTVLLAIVGGLSLLLAVALLLFDEDTPEETSAGRDTYSVSALGHRLLADLLGELGFRVLSSQSGSAVWDPHTATLVLADPPVDDQSGDLESDLAYRAGHADTVLLVLPKRRSEPDYYDHWVESTELIDIERVEHVLAALGVGGRLARLPEEVAAPEFRHADGRVLALDLLGAQLLTSDDVEAVVSGPTGILLGRVTGDAADEGRDLWILTDPDLIATHGLPRAGNAELVVETFERLGSRERPIVFDEWLHGHRRKRSLWGELLRFPLVFGLAHAGLVLGLLLWASLGRFGAAEPPRPPLAAGRRTLIENTADLLVHGGHGGSVLRRYFERTIDEVARAFHAPPDADAASRFGVVERASATRRTRERPGILAEEVRSALHTRRGAKSHVGARRALIVAVRIHRWRQEVLHGPTEDRRNRA